MWTDWVCMYLVRGHSPMAHQLASHVFVGVKEAIVVTTLYVAAGSWGDGR